jgi:predicted Zn finger-like uncharacterized protein
LPRAAPPRYKLEVIVTCPECGARYRLADDAIPPEGRAMRCAGCSHRWYQAAPDAPQPPPELPAALQAEFGIETPTPPAALVTAPAPEPTPEQLAWTPAPEDEDERPDDAPRPRTLLKNIVAVLLGLAFTAASALLWVPGLDVGKLDLPRIVVPAVDLSQVPWLDRLVNPPPPPANPLTITFTTDHQALADGRPLFVIAGTIENPTATPQKVGAISGHLVGPANTISLAWRIAPPVATLPPHQRVTFDSSAIGQPYGGERVTLRFAD